MTAMGSSAQIVTVVPETVSRRAFPNLRTGNGQIKPRASMISLMEPDLPIVGRKVYCFETSFHGDVTDVQVTPLICTAKRGYV